MRPYTYSIRCKIDNTFYYGIRYSMNRKTEFDIGIHYFSSSKTVKNKIKEMGIENFSFEVRKVFEDIDKAKKWETKVINKVIRYANCLNENCAGVISLKYCSIGGKSGGRKGILKSLEVQRENKTGLFSEDKWIQKLGNAAGSSAGGKAGGLATKEMKIGIFGMSAAEKKKARSNGGHKSKELGVGIFGMSYEQNSDKAVKAAKTKAELDYVRCFDNIGNVHYIPRKEIPDSYIVIDKNNPMHQRIKHVHKDGAVKFAILNTEKSNKLLQEGYEIKQQMMIQDAYEECKALANREWTENTKANNSPEK